MSVMSMYARAYPIGRLREFSAWTEKIPVHPVDGEEQAFVFLHDTFVVTAGVFQDEGVIFDSVTEGWKEFCTNHLSFSVPQDVASMDAEMSARESAMRENAADREPVNTADR